jgi:hypothetical protein
MLLAASSIFPQKRDFEDEKRKSRENEKVKAIMSCVSSTDKPSKVFMDPNVSTDVFNDQVGTSWTFKVRRIKTIGGKKYYKGHLVSPRGGHTADVGYIDPNFWTCDQLK